MNKKILITGGSGYIGNYITKMLAASHPSVQVVAMSRRSVEEQQRRDSSTARFTNVSFLSGDCLNPKSYPEKLESYDAIIHTVGTLLEGVDYKSFIRSENPFAFIHEALNRDACKLMAEHFNSACKNSGKKGHFVFISASKTIAPGLHKYSEMKEQAEQFLLNYCQQNIFYFQGVKILNREIKFNQVNAILFINVSQILIDNLIKHIYKIEQIKIGLLIQLLLHLSIFELQNMLNFRDQNSFWVKKIFSFQENLIYIGICLQNITPVILRPGFVWNQKERGWSYPLSIATDFGYEINKKVIQNLPGNEALQVLLPQSKSINLSLLSEFAIQGALGELDQLNKTKIWTNEQMNQFAKS